MADSITGICNRALSNLGSQTQIADLNEMSPAAAQCRLWYDNCRQGLLRAAPWGFARRQAALTLLSELVLDQNTSPYPQLYKYQYPSDCLKFRYLTPPQQNTQGIIPPQVGVGLVGPSGYGPSRQYRYLINYSSDATNPTVSITSNVQGAIGYYTADVQNPDAFDTLFASALTAAIAFNICLAITGNSGLRAQQSAIADAAMMQARQADANETRSTTDHKVDWISARGTGNAYWANDLVGPGYDWGSWYAGDDQMSWGM